MAHSETSVSLQLAPNTKSNQTHTARHANILGKSAAIRQARDLVRKSAYSTIPVLITGETGTGKGLFAQAIHAQGRHRRKPFLTLDCATPDGLSIPGVHPLASLQHGTDSNTQASISRLQSAGTLYLDEVGDLPPAEQSRLVQLLRLLDQLADVRIVAATHHALDALVEAGTFREDLYFRLAGYPIQLPPLRDRVGDIPDLSHYFCREYCARYYKQGIQLSTAALNAIQRYSFPGNVRELQHGIERAVLLCDTDTHLTPAHLPERWLTSQLIEGDTEGSSGETAPTMSLREAVADFETRMIVATLVRHEWNQTHTATALGIPRRTLIDKMQRFHIMPPARRRG